MGPPGPCWGCMGLFSPHPPCAYHHHNRYVTAFHSLKPLTIAIAHTQCMPHLSASALSLTPCMLCSLFGYYRYWEGHYVQLQRPRKSTTSKRENNNNNRRATQARGGRSRAAGAEVCGWSRKSPIKAAGYVWGQKCSGIKRGADLSDAQIPRLGSCKRLNVRLGRIGVWAYGLRGRVVR